MKTLKITPQSGFRVLASTDRSQVAAMVLQPGETTGGPNNRHPTSDQWLYVVSGEGEAIIDGERHSLPAGTLLLIEAGEAHEILNVGAEPLTTFNIYAPPEY
jgi:mannose-6-phosphate isomerase-like protein (cupin superfamily)